MLVNYYPQVFNMILTSKIKEHFSAAIIGLNADVKIHAFLIWMKDYIKGSYPFSERNFKDFSRTFPELRLIFHGL